MSDIITVAETIQKMADGFAEEVMKCLDANRDIAVQAVKEQLYSGLSGDDSLLSPNYDDDPYFEEDAFWWHRNDDYKVWKYKITPPTPGWMLNIPPRPMHVPNLYIDGTFYGTITAFRNGDALTVAVSEPKSKEIVAKWGDNILNLGGEARGYFSYTLILPWVWDYFEQCGW